MQTNVSRTTRARVLLVDDEPGVTECVERSLRKEPLEFASAHSAREALELLDRAAFDVVVSDERMPGMQGSEFLAIVREQHPDVVRIILSGQASVEAAVRAINSAQIYRFLVKPCPAEEIGLTIREALRARDERRNYERWTAAHDESAEQERARAFQHLADHAWMGFQPILAAGDESVFAYEALLRCDETDWHGPEAFFHAADALGRSHELARRVRSWVAARIHEERANACFFVNANPHDLDDEEFLAGRDELAPHARRVVIELTERDSLKSLSSLDAKVKRLREAGYRIALDDLGAGYAGLTSIAQVAPDIVKLDMELVRGIDASPTKQKLVGALVRMCNDLGIRTLAEGVETPEERDVVVALGCTYLQGYLFGRAARAFRAP